MSFIKEPDRDVQSPSGFRDFRPTRPCRSEIDIPEIPKLRTPTKLGRVRHAELPNINPNRHVLISGITQSGKSTLCKELIYNYIKSGVVFSRVYAFIPTIDLQDTYDFLNPKFIMTEFTDENLTYILEEQMKKPPNIHVCLIIDDFIGHVNLNNNKMLDRVITAGSKYRITCVILTQNLNKLSTTIKSNCYYLFLTGGLGNQSLKTAWELQKSISLEKWNDFKSYINQACVGYHFVLFLLMKLTEHESTEPYTFAIENFHNFLLEYN